MGIGHSPLMFLDEPSAAVDAGAKRHLWKVIKNRAPDQTVVLTTHSMEEAEALCDRLAIQVKGQLRCLGTPMHIRNKYGFGYQLELFATSQASRGSTMTAGGPSQAFFATSTSTETTASGSADRIMNFVRTSISSEAKLIEHHGDRFLFQLPALSGQLSLGRVLTNVTMHKHELGIYDWSIERPTLEQV